MKLNKTFLLLSCALTSTQALSAAFQLAEHSASGLGRAFAGEAAIAEDASVVARNPALMSQFDKEMLTVVASYVKPDVSLDGTEAPAGSTPSSLDQSSIAPSAIIPAFYYVKPMSDKLALGVGTFSNFGLATEFSDDYAAGQLAGETGITTINLNLSASYKLNEQISLGLGANVVYADAELTRHFGETSLLPDFIKPAPETVAADMAGDDIAFGWNIGATYQINDSHRLGFSYRSEVDVALEGEYTNELPAMLGGLEGAKVGGSLDITLPAIAEFSGLHKVTPTTSVHYSVMWTGWSSFDKLEAYVDIAEEPVFAKTENFSDSYRFALGATHVLNDVVTLRVGVAYDESPADKNHLSISIPDTDRLWLTTGVNYKFSDSSSVDFGLAYIKGDEQEFTESDELGQQWGFKSEGNASIASLQYNHAF
ncbi:outer membrane protein transport protein [Thalassotalea atypica]|uniref:outer membrane protein transport protein n=1 Tax=Thalassotalea atypica TaxID=2054316 RepID=UPI00257313F8|nr:outer membrane protein transport protein [Thalassotalea atypica]